MEHDYNLIKENYTIMFNEYNNKTNFYNDSDKPIILQQDLDLIENVLKVNDYTSMYNQYLNLLYKMLFIDKLDKAEQEQQATRLKKQLNYLYFIKLYFDNRNFRKISYICFFSHYQSKQNKAFYINKELDILLESAIDGKIDGINEKVITPPPIAFLQPDFIFILFSILKEYKGENTNKENKRIENQTKLFEEKYKDLTSINPQPFIDIKDAFIKEFIDIYNYALYKDNEENKINYGDYNNDIQDIKEIEEQEKTSDNTLIPTGQFFKDYGNFEAGLERGEFKENKYYKIGIIEAELDNTIEFKGEIENPDKINLIDSLKFRDKSFTYISRRLEHIVKSDKSESKEENGKKKTLKSELYKKAKKHQITEEDLQEILKPNKVILSPTTHQPIQYDLAIYLGIIKDSNQHRAKEKLYNIARHLGKLKIQRAEKSKNIEQINIKPVITDINFLIDHNTHETALLIKQNPTITIEMVEGYILSQWKTEQDIFLEATSNKEIPLIQRIEKFYNEVIFNEIEAELFINCLTIINKGLYKWNDKEYNKDNIRTFIIDYKKPYFIGTLINKMEKGYNIITNHDKGLKRKLQKVAYTLNKLDNYIEYSDISMLDINILHPTKKQIKDIESQQITIKIKDIINNNAVKESKRLKRFIEP